MTDSVITGATILASLMIHAAFGYAATRADPPPPPRSRVAVRLQVVKKPPRALAAPVVEPAQPRLPKPKAPQPRAERHSAAQKQALPAPAPSREAAVFETNLVLGNPAARGRGPNVAAGETAPRARPVREKLLTGDGDDCPEAPTKPKPIARPVEIAYPPSARAAGIAGRLILRLSIDPGGAVVGAEILQSVDPALDRAAIAAVKTWRFAPGTRCGRAAPSTYTLARRFELDRE